jgi:CheY-like chemotaxis protein
VFPEYRNDEFNVANHQYIEDPSMSSHTAPLAVRLIGFTPHEIDTFEATFEIERGAANSYFWLADGNLQDPDLYIANGDDLKALAILSELRPTDVRPALVVGEHGDLLPYVSVEKPVRWRKLFEALDKLVEKRAQALAGLDAAGIVPVPERRRRDRVDLDITDPADYVRMRVQSQRKGGVLIVDKGPAFHQLVAETLVRHNVAVAWAGNEVKAVELCLQGNISAVIINTSTPGVDPYRLSQLIRKPGADPNMVVICLVGKPFLYDQVRANSAGMNGFLNKPITSAMLLSTLMKFLPLSRR